MSENDISNDMSKELIDQVRQAIDKQQPLSIEGNGTKRFLGRRSDAAVDAQKISVSGHSGILTYEPVELVMTARAGTTLGEIDAVLDENQQMLACDPARFGGQATIGGSLAANQSGPARPWLGSLRDHVLGVGLINGKAEHLQFGGQVMKNVAGYDVSRLQAGAMGTLGVMTEVSFKVLPKPALTATLCQSMSADDAVAIMNRLAGTPKPISGAAWVDDKLYIRLSGACRAVESTSEQWQKEWELDVLDTDKADAFWQRLRDQQLAFFNETEKPLWRFSIKSTAPSLPNNSQAEQSLLIDWCGSQRWLSGDYSHSELQEWAAQQGGEVSLYRDAQSGDAAKDVFYQADPVVQRIQSNIKQSFDPANIFNNGRLYAWM